MYEVDRNQNGFGLVHVLIFLAVISGSIFYSMESNVGTLERMDRIVRETNASMMQDKLNLIFANSQFCTASLVGQHVKLLGQVTEDVVLKKPNKEGVAVDWLVPGAPTTEDDRLWVKKLSIQKGDRSGFEATSFSKGNFKGYLTIELEKKDSISARATYIGKQEFKIDLEMQRNLLKWYVASCGLTREGFSKSFRTPSSVLREYNDGLPETCSGWSAYDAYYFNSACSRMCRNGCSGEGGGCTEELEGIEGFQGGFGSECKEEGGETVMSCVCIPGEAPEES